MASPYPITIDKVSLGYTRGSSDKEYHLVLIQAANGKKMFISRFGKRGTWGTMDVDYSGSAPAMFQKKLKEKTGKGYQTEHQAMNLSCGDLADFRHNLGDAYWHKLSPAQREHLSGGADSGEPSWAATPQPAPEPAKPLTEAERYANNPLWGAF